MSSAIMIGKLHGKVKEAFFLDCGSIWDAFVGIGGQRDWRKNLYNNPKDLEDWKRRNLNGLYRKP